MSSDDLLRSADLSRHDYFAGQALAGLVAARGRSVDDVDLATELAHAALRLADAMEAARFARAARDEAERA